MVKYGFPRKHERITINRNPSLSGYNLGTITFEEGEKYDFIEETEAYPPDDWGGTAVVISKKAPKDNPGDYWDLIRIAEPKCG